MAAKKNPANGDETTGTEGDETPAVPARNLTQEGLEGYFTSKLQEPPPLGEGLSPEAAAAKAKARAARMCREG
jgi:hypothetical protein